MEYCKAKKMETFPEHDVLYACIKYIFESDTDTGVAVVYEALYNNELFVVQMRMDGNNTAKVHDDMGYISDLDWETAMKHIYDVCNWTVKSEIIEQ